MRIICAKRERTLLETLRPVAEKIDRLGNSDNTFFSMDRQFHCALVALCGNDTLSAEYERISRLTFFYNISNFVPLSQSQIQQSHLDFLEVLMTADPDTAQRAVHAHIASGKQDLILSV